MWLAILFCATGSQLDHTAAFHPTNRVLVRRVVSLLKFSANHPATTDALGNTLVPQGGVRLPSEISAWTKITTHRGYVSSIYQGGDDTRGCLKIVMFRSHRCRRCRYLHNKLTRDMRDGRVRGNAEMYEVDVSTDTGQDLAQLMGVQAVPTFIVYRDGEDLYQGLNLYGNALFRCEVLRTEETPEE